MVPVGRAVADVPAWARGTGDMEVGLAIGLTEIWRTVILQMSSDSSICNLLVFDQAAAAVH